MAEVKSNVTGTVMQILVNVGDKVANDQDVITVESMKMEMMVPSSASGAVKEIHVAPGDFIQEGQVLLVVG